MSEHDEKQPLTRRERRMRELGETGALDLSEARTAPESGDGATGSAQSASSADVQDDRPADGPGDIVISPFNEDGTPRSRREIRALREQAMAERAHETSQSAGSEPADQEQPAVEDPAVDSRAEAEAESAGEEASSAGVEAMAEAELTTSSGAPAADEAPAETVAASAGEPEEADSVEKSVEAEAPETDAAAEQADAGRVVPAEVDGESTETGKILADLSNGGATKPPAPEVDFDSLIAPPTEAYNIEELRAAERGPAAEALAADEDLTEDSLVDPSELFEQTEAGAGDEAVVAEVSRDEAPEAGPAAVAPEEAEADEPVVADEAAVEPAAKPKRRFWQRGRNEEQTPTNASEDDASDGDATEHDSDAAEAADAQQPVIPAESPDVLPQAPAKEESGSIPAPVSAVPPVSARSEEASRPDEAKAEAQRETYSFPDIAPPEEWRSVFDDPSSRVVPTQPRSDGDFDDLISRAVAQEGSTTSSTSALILPNMPEDTGGLTGPLGATGDLYVTGSMKLPKSLGETGGHAALHDSIEIDPITGEVAEEPVPVHDGPAPVAARHAVSARVSTGATVVAKPTKEKSKLPLVLALTGGGLLVVVVGIGVYGAANGMFG